MKKNFYSDNVSGASPEILQALVAANEGDTAPYGGDAHSNGDSGIFFRRLYRHSRKRHAGHACDRNPNSSSQPYSSTRHGATAGDFANRGNVTAKNRRSDEYPHPLAR